MAARLRRWRRALLWLAFGLALALLVAAGQAWQLWQRLQQEQGIVALDWQGLSLSAGGLRLEHLELQQLAADGRRLQLAAREVQLAWSLALGAARLERLTLEQLQLDWQAPATPTGQASRLPTADELAALLAWLPRQLQVQRIDARLPCPAAPCQLAGSLQLQHPGAALLPASLQLELVQGEHRLRLQGALDGSLDAARLQLSLELDDQPHLSLDARLASAGDQRALHGTLQLPARPPAPWLQQWLEPMFGAAVQPLARLPDELQASAEWRLLLPATWRPQDGPPPSAQLEQMRLQASLPRWRSEALDLREVSAALDLNGHWQEQRLQLTCSADSRIAIGRLSGPDDLRLDQLQASLAGLQLARVADGPLQLAGPLAVHTRRLQQAQLQPQHWDWQGRLAATATEFRLSGPLRNAAGLAVELQLQRPASGELQLRGRLGELALAGANPLAKTLRGWPALLELSAGQLQAEGSLQLPAGSAAPTAELSLQLAAVAGIYDRSELSGLDARLQATLHDGQLALALPQLQVARLNPGVPLGPLQLRADYQAPLRAPLAGRLQLWQADSQLLGGHLQTLPVALDLAHRPLALAVQVRGLELAELLKVYPAEGLSGSGVLDGELPLRLEDDGLHIDQGRLAARAPGGVLQLRSERIRAFGQNNPALRLATTALEDFRYDRLDSQVDYAPQGKLLLALRLAGRNPALEGGRPVNFTINLEENVPALLTSLQLSGRVNEAIQRRVQQKLQRRD